MHTRCCKRRTKKDDLCNKKYKLKGLECNQQLSELKLSFYCYQNTKNNINRAKNERKILPQLQTSIK